MAEAAALKLLLLGSSGQVGAEWRRLLGADPQGRDERWTVSMPASTSERAIHLEVLAPSRSTTDLADPEGLRVWVKAHAPDIIVNAAAYTAVDRAESEPALARAVNATSPTVLAEVAQASGACLLHYSTDYVFEGLGQRAYREDDPVHPLSVYGLTKAEGEAGIRQHLARHLILRTSWVMGVHGGNFLKTMLRLAAERDRLRVVGDQVGVPTPARMLAQLGWHALQRCLHAEWQGEPPGTPAPWGLYHLAPRGETNWFEYACFVMGMAQARGWSLKAGPGQIEPITTAEYPTPARRPANSRLDCTRFARTFEVLPPTWQEGVLATLDELKAMTS